MKLPLEFQSGNEIPVTRAVISRERMTEILEESAAQLRRILDPLVQGHRTHLTAWEIKELRELFNLTE